MDEIWSKTIISHIEQSEERLGKRLEKLSGWGYLLAASMLINIALLLGLIIVISLLLSLI